MDGTRYPVVRIAVWPEAFASGSAPAAINWGSNALLLFCKLVLMEHGAACRPTAVNGRHGTPCKQMLY